MDEVHGALRIAWMEDYIRDVYWVTMTMSTVGYGDVSPTGTISRLYAVAAMLISPFFFGTIVSMLTHATSGLFHDEVNKRSSDAKRFMRYRNVPRELEKRVVQNLRHHLRCDRTMSIAPELFKNLSPAVQRELTLELLRSTVLEFPLFRGAGINHSFVAEVAEAHVWVEAVPGDLVVEEGQLEEELVFVVQGRLVLELGADPDPQWLKKGLCYGNGCQGTQVEMETGAWFGEACLFVLDRVRGETAVAILESELAV